MIFPDPQVKVSDWKAETERVTSKLLTGRAAKAATGWQNNFVNFKDHAKAANISNGGESENMMESLRLLSTQIVGSLGALSRIENILNSRNSTSLVRKEYKDFRTVRTGTVFFLHDLYLNNFAHSGIPFDRREAENFIRESDNIDKHFNGRYRNGR